MDLRSIINAGTQGEALGHIANTELNTAIQNLSANQYLIAMRIDPRPGGIITIWSLIREYALISKALEDYCFSYIMVLHQTKMMLG